MDNIKLPILEINKYDIFTNNKNKCVRKNYNYDEYKKIYAVVQSYEELLKYIPDDKTLRDTGKYILECFKTGIYVSFKDGKLDTFLLLNNKDYTSPYQDKIKIANKYKKNQKFKIVQCLLRYDDNYETYYIDFYVMELFYFLSELSKNRKVPDSNFYINYRDQVLIKKIDNIYYDPFVEVVGNKKLDDKWQKCELGKLFSFCNIKDYMDIPFPATDDINRVLKIYIPDNDNSGICNNNYLNEKLNIPWNEKKPIAFFRGQSTGCGNSIESNPRIKLAYLDSKWNKDNNKQILDAKIVRWVQRLKKSEKDTEFNKINTYELEKQGIKLAQKVPLNEVYKYKYVINVDGNISAFRLGFLLGIGSTILMVEGKYKLWFEQWLIEGVHYIRIKEDLSNLKEKIEWCINHDDECKKIAENSVKFFNDKLTLEPIYDYMVDTINLLNNIYK